MNENKNGVLLTIIGAATLLVAIVGASFAYFSATGGTATQNVNTGVLKISAVAGSITQANITPATVSEYSATATEEEEQERIDALLASSDVVKMPITVTTTDTTVSSEYNMFLTTAGIALDETKTGGSPDQLKWELLQGTDGSETTVARGNFANGDVTKLQINTTPVNIPTNGSVDEYKLVIYIANTEDTVPGDNSGVQDKLQGMKFTAYTTVEAKQK